MANLTTLWRYYKEPAVSCRHKACLWLTGWLSCFSHVQLFVTLWTVAHQAPLPIGILQAGILEWVAMPSSRASSQPRGQICIFWISCIAGGFFTTELMGKPPQRHYVMWKKTHTHKSLLYDSIYMELNNQRRNGWSLKNTTVWKQNHNVVIFRLEIG